MSVALFPVALEAVGVITIASGGDATASGATVSSTASFIAGAATGSGNGTATGQLFVSNASFISGSASGVMNATVSGATMTVLASFLGGSASGNVPTGTKDSGKLHISISISI